MSRNGRRRSLVWPLILISIGVLFLLSNLGVVDWNVWSILWRMWPVLIVAIGLDLMFGRRSGVWQAITVAVLIGLFAGAYWLFDVTEKAWSGEKVVQTINHEVDGAEEADVTIKMNIGSLILGGLPTSSDTFVSGKVEISEFEVLTDDVQIRGDKLTYILSSEGRQYQPGWIFNRDIDNDKQWDLMFTPEVLINLNIDTGVGRTEIDLSNLQLADVDLNSGVGEVIVYLPDDGDFQASIRAGVGKMEIYIPKDLAVGIFIDSGLGNVSVIGDFSQRGENYFSQDYSSSPDKVELYVDGGVGNIRIVQN